MGRSFRIADGEAKGKITIKKLHDRSPPNPKGSCDTVTGKGLTTYVQKPSQADLQSSVSPDTRKLVMDARDRNVMQGKPASKVGLRVTK